MKQNTTEIRRSKILSSKWIEENGLSGLIIGYDAPDEDEWLETVRQDYRAFERCPIKSNKSIWKEALSKDGMLIRFVDHLDQCREMVDTAIRQNVDAAEYCDIEFYGKNYSLWQKVILPQRPKMIGTLIEFRGSDDVPKSLIEYAVKRDWTVLDYVPENEITPRLAAMALRQSGLALKYLMDSYLWDPKKMIPVYIKAVKNTPSAIDFVPEEVLEFVRKGV